MDGRENPTSSGTPENSTQGGIFSSPDLTVNTENVPTLGGGREVSEGEVSGGNAERIAAAFSQTDATRQKAATAAAMQQTPLVTPIPSTATEDIQLPGEKKKRSKLPFVIGLVVLVVAVAVGGIVWGMNRKETSSVHRSALDEFDRFATYFLYGEERDSFNEEFSPSAVYTVELNLTATTDSNIFWNQSLNLLDQALEQYQNSESPSSEALNLMTAYKQDLEFLNLYRKITTLTATELLERYLANGVEASLQSIKEIYTDFLESENMNAQLYYEFRITQYSNMLIAFNIYDKAGCIQDNNLNESCINHIQSSNNKDLESAASIALEAQQEAQDLIDASLSTAISNCWYLKLRLQGNFLEGDLAE